MRGRRAAGEEAQRGRIMRGGEDSEDWRRC